MAKKKINQDTQIAELLTRGVAEVIERDHLEERLRRGDTLRVKFGIDPTAPDIHLGHLVPLRKLRQFQDLGHTAVLIIGDYTATVGDPSGKSETRSQLDPESVRANMETYLAQARVVLDVDRAEVRYNSEWFSKMTALDFAMLSSKITVQRVLERDDFQKRLKEDRDVSILEVLYPLLQGYDSVMVRADVELGGTDQKFNLLMGRKLQKRYGQKPQDVLTVPLLEGLDGIKKMSKSTGNYIGLTEASDVMYGKIMSIPDTLIVRYFELCTGLSDEEIRVAMAVENQRDAKMTLAQEVVRMLHGAEAADRARDAFVKTFQKHETPDEVKTVKVSAKGGPASGGKSKKYRIAELLVEVVLATSKSDARRTIGQKGVKVDGRVVDDPDAVVEIPKAGVLIQKGKRHFVRVMSG